MQLFRFKYHLALASDEKADNLNYRYARLRLLSLIALTREYRKMHKAKYLPRQTNNFQRNRVHYEERSRRISPFTFRRRVRGALGTDDYGLLFLGPPFLRRLTYFLRNRVSSLDKDPPPPLRLATLPSGTPSLPSSRRGDE